MVPCMTGTLIKFFFASSIPLVIASCTSFAFPKPCPTTPFSFPTTTNAEKLNERPPFVVFTTRLMATTLSFNSRSPAFTLVKLTFAIFYFENLKIKISIHLLLHHQQRLLHDRDINNHHDQKPLLSTQAL